MHSLLIAMNAVSFTYRFYFLLLMAMRAGGGIYTLCRWIQTGGAGNFSATGCMKSSNTGIPIIYIDFQFSFHSRSRIQSLTTFFFFCLLLFYVSVQSPVVSPARV